MKKALAFIFVVLMSVPIFGQTPKVDDRVSKVETQIKTLTDNISSLNGQVSSLQLEISQLRDRYAQYQKQLDLHQITSVTVDTIAYGVVSAVGDKSTGTVIVTLSGINKGTQDCILLFNEAQLNDYNGNIVNIPWTSSFGNINIGGSASGNREYFRTNIANKIYLTFKNVEVGARISSLTLVEIDHHKGSGDGVINFRDVEIQWK